MAKRRLDLSTLPLTVHGHIVHTPGLRLAVEQARGAVLRARAAEKTETPAATGVSESPELSAEYTALPARVQARK